MHFNYNKGTITLDLDVEQLKAFHTVAGRLSFTRAAAVLNLSQPAVSRRIAALEDQTGLTLFERHGRSLVLTDAGRSLYEYASRVLDLLEETGRMIVAYRHQDRGKIAVAAESSVAGHLLPPVLEAFQTKHPGVEVEVLVGQAKEVENSVRKGRANVAFWGGPLPPGLHAEPYAAEELALVVSRNHPWAEAEDLEPAALKRERLILSGRDTLLRALVDSFLAFHCIEPERVWEVDGSRTAGDYAARGFGVAFLPAAALADADLGPPLTECPAPAMRIPYQVSVVSAKDRLLSPGALAFMAQTKKP